MKNPAEMSRRELLEFQKEMEEEDLEPEFISDEDVKKSTEFLELQKEMEGITPIRHEWIRKYLNRYKNQPKRIKIILEMAEESEAYTKLFMPEDKYVHFLDAMPDLKEYTANVLKEEEERLAK